MSRFEETGPPSQRGTMLTVMLIFLVGGGFLLFMVVVTGGFFAFALVIYAGLGLFGCLHYLLWGHRFNESVQKERRAIEETLKAEEAAESRPWERRF